MLPTLVIAYLASVPPSILYHTNPILFLRLFLPCNPCAPGMEPPHPSSRSGPNCSKSNAIFLDCDSFRNRHVTQLKTVRCVEIFLGLPETDLLALFGSSRRDPLSLLDVVIYRLEPLHTPPDQPPKQLEHRGGQPRECQCNGAGIKLMPALSLEQWYSECRVNCLLHSAMT